MSSQDPIPNTRDILTAAISDNRRNVTALLASIKEAAMRRGLDPAHGISIRIDALKFSYCLCTAKEEGSFVIRKHET